jgi:hypothetical protein
MRKTSEFAIFTLSITFLIYLFLSDGVHPMTSKKAYMIDEPLLIEGEQQNIYSVLPAGTVLYLDKSWPEGHQTFHVYFHFKGDFNATPTDPGLISPIWLRTVDREELPKLLNNYPLSKKELATILKARSVTKAELTQILRDWPDD